MQFDTALVRVAERLARELGGRALEGTGDSGQEKKESVLQEVPDLPGPEEEGEDGTLAGLLDFLELPEETRAYWIQRAEMEQERKERATRDEAAVLGLRETCHACAAEKGLLRGAEQNSWRVNLP